MMVGTVDGRWQWRCFISWPQRSPLARDAAPAQRP